MTTKKRRHAPKFDDDYLTSLAQSGAPASTPDPTPATDNQDYTGITQMLEETPIPGVIIPTERNDQFRVNLEHIHSYDNNPRLASHADDAIQSLAWSIFTSGLINPISITKRPHEAHFIVAKGGNGRLRALNYIVDNYDALAQQLPEGTQPRPRPEFAKPITRFEPFESEMTIFEAHLDENLEREDTIWADTAHGLTTLKNLMEAQQGSRMSNRDFARRLEESGRFKKIRSLESIGRALFTTTQLAPVIQWNPRVLTNGHNSIGLLRQIHRDCQIVYCTFKQSESPDEFNALCIEWTKQFCDTNPNEDPNTFAAELTAHWILCVQDAIGLDDETAHTVWTNLGSKKPGGNAFKLPAWDMLLTPIPTEQPPNQDPTASTETPDDPIASDGNTDEAPSPGTSSADGATSTPVRQRVSRTERMTQLRSSMASWRQAHAELDLPQPVSALVEHITSQAETQDPLLNFLAHAHTQPATEHLAKELITFMRVLVAHSIESATNEQDPAPTSSANSNP